MEGWRRAGSTPIDRSCSSASSTVSTRPPNLNYGGNPGQLNNGIDRRCTNGNNTQSTAKRETTIVDRRHLCLSELMYCTWLTEQAPQASFHPCSPSFVTDGASHRLLRLGRSAEPTQALCSRVLCTVPIVQNIRSIRYLCREEVPHRVARETLNMKYRRYLLRLSIWRLLRLGYFTCHACLQGRYTGHRDGKVCLLIGRGAKP